MIIQLVTAQSHKLHREIWRSSSLGCFEAEALPLEISDLFIGFTVEWQDSPAQETMVSVFIMNAHGVAISRVTELFKRSPDLQSTVHVFQMPLFVCHRHDQYDLHISFGDEGEWRTFEVCPL